MDPPTLDRKRRRADSPSDDSNNEPSRVPAVKQTPAGLKVSCIDSGRGLEEDRKAAMQDAGEYIDEIKHTFFFEHYLPPLREGFDVNTVVRKLQENGTIKNGVWTAFKSVPTDKIGLFEDHVFAAVETIAGAIASACALAFTCDIPAQFICNPRRTPNAKTRDSTCRPDAYLILCILTDKDKIYWEQIAIPAEFKLREQQAEENGNNSQMLWNLQQTMRNDAMRMFVFGFSVVGTSVRIWRTDRSFITISDSFDFVKDYRLVVHFFMAVIFASPEQLGWDTTMTRNRHTGKYDIVVCGANGQSQIFRTIKVINIVKADALRGTASRVWLCAKLKKSGKPIPRKRFVVKDGWVDSNKTREGARYDEIEADAAEHENSEEMLASLARLFIPRECHGDVMASDGSPYCTKDRPNTRQKYFLTRPTRTDHDTTTRAFKTRKTIGNHCTGATGKKSSGSESPQLDYHPKTHYRIVLNGVGTPLHEVHSLAMVFRALYEIIMGLRTLHDLGWCHRDVGASNIVVIDGHPKLVDLEYAKKRDETTYHNIRTATNYFVPVEMESQDFLFEYSPPRQAMPKRKRVRRGWDTSSESEADSEPSDDVLPIVPAVLVYNPLHELESLVWIGLYFFICHVERVDDETKRSPDYKSRLVKQQAYAQKLFHNLEQRRALLFKPTDLRKNLASFLPPSLSDAGEIMADILELLCDTYGLERSTHPHNLDFFALTEEYDIHRQMYKKFKAIHDIFSNNDVLVDRLDDPKVQPQDQNEESDSGEPVFDGPDESSASESDDAE